MDFPYELKITMEASDKMVTKFLLHEPFQECRKLMSVFNCPSSANLLSSFFSSSPRSCSKLADRATTVCLCTVKCMLSFQFPNVCLILYVLKFLLSASGVCFLRLFRFESLALEIKHIFFPISLILPTGWKNNLKYTSKPTSVDQLVEFLPLR